MISHSTMLIDSNTHVPYKSLHAMLLPTILVSNFVGRCHTLVVASLEPADTAQVTTASSYGFYHGRST